MTAVPDAALHAARILIVDDEPVNVELLEAVLRRAGYTALTGTTDPRLVLDVYRRERPDLLLLDLLMPRLDGYTVLQQLQTVVDPDEYFPVLVLTADITPEAKRRALASGAKDFLTKPFDQTEILLRIRNLLETRILYLQLQQQYHLLEDRFSQAQDAIQARDAAQSAYSHDLGQPASALHIASQILRRRLARGEAVDRAALVEHAEAIDSMADQVLAITSELLDVSRLQAGRSLDLRYSDLDLVALVRTEVAVYQATTDRHTIRLETALPELRGEWDETRLRRVVSNLLSNAVKYTPRGGEIVVRLEREAGEGREWALLSVQDPGIGIPAADLPKLFTPFYRASNAVETTKGTGVGLASARQIVEEHGGTLSVASSEGAGTTVTVRLPLD